MAITATIGGSNDVRVTKVYVPSETLGLSNLPDVDSSTKTDGAAVIWNSSSGKYTPTGVITSAIDDTDDLTEGSTNLYHTTARARTAVGFTSGVTITSAADDEFLRYNGTAWVNEAVTLVTSVSGLTDTTISSIASGDMLSYNGSAWVNAPLTSVAGDFDVGGDLTVTGLTTLNGGTLTLGDSTSDNIVFGAEINSDMIPNTDNTYNLGSSSKEWKNLYIDGTAHIDTLDIDNNATVNGNLTCKGHVDLQDDDKIKVGTGDDMQIYHDGSNSYMTNDVGALKIATEDSGIAVTIGHATSEVTVADNLTITGNISIQGDTTLGNATSDNITVTGRLASHVLPIADDTYDLGSSALRFRTLYLSSSTLDLGGATISSDGSGTLTIASSGAVLPAGSKVGSDTISIADETTGQLKRDVPLFTQAGGLGSAAVTFAMKANGPSELLFTTFTLASGTAITAQERTFFSF